MNEFYEHGVSIFLEVTFYDVVGNQVDPSQVRITFYDYKYNIIDVRIDDIERTGLGKYSFVFTPPDNPKFSSVYNYEWRGLIGGLVSLKRGTIRTKFIV